MCIVPAFTIATDAGILVETQPELNECLRGTEKESLRGPETDRIQKSVVVAFRLHSMLRTERNISDP